jgi:hypothetical protein
MSLYSGISGEARQLVREHHRLLERLPRSFLVSILLELEKWPTLFSPEKNYYRILINHLARLSANQFEETFTGVQAVELQLGTTQVSGERPRQIQETMQAALRKAGLFSRWRAEIDNAFQRIQPELEAQLYSGNTPPRLVVIVYGKGIAIERSKLWKRFRSRGVRVPLDLQGAAQAELFLHSLFTGYFPGVEQVPSSLFSILRGSDQSTVPDAWIVETGGTLHAVCETYFGREQMSRNATGMSFERLRSYREELTKALHAKILSGVSGPLELAAYARGLKVTPTKGLDLYSDEVVLAFVRDVFLGGNGTLIMNNSFVEWASVQAVKRAQPRFLVARFGVRDKMKPFSSLLLFSQPRPTDQIPILEDPLGSFVDVELLSYYIWLNAEKVLPYRNRTLYLLLAEGVDEMMAVLPGDKRPTTSELATATLPDVFATMARWLQLPLPNSPGRIITALV